MAHLEYSPITHEAGLVIDRDEAKLLIPFLKRCLKKEKKLEMKYQDIQDSGEATERQQTTLMKHQQVVIQLECIIEQAGQLAKVHKTA